MNESIGVFSSLYRRGATNPFALNKQKSLGLNCTLKVRQKKSNFWGVFIMKLTYEDNILIYEQTILNCLNNNQKTALKCENI